MPSITYNWNPYVEANASSEAHAYTALQSGQIAMQAPMMQPARAAGMFNQGEMEGTEPIFYNPWPVAEDGYVEPFVPEYQPTGPTGAGGDWGGDGNGIYNVPGASAPPFKGQLIPDVGLPIHKPFNTSTPGPTYYQLPGVPEPTFDMLEPEGGYPPYSPPNLGPYGNGAYNPPIGYSPSVYGPGFIPGGELW